MVTSLFGSTRRMEPARLRISLRPRPALLFSLPTLILVAVPLMVMVREASSVGAPTLAQTLATSTTAQMLWNTLRLSLSVMAVSLVLGSGLAWIVERTDLPFRRVWAVLLVCPFAVPDFVASFSLPNLVYSLNLAPLYPLVQGYWGSVLIMTLVCYPLVFLPVSAGLRSADASLEEASRSLGRGTSDDLRQGYPSTDEGGNDSRRLVGGLDDPCRV